MQDVTQLLRAIEGGDVQATEDLLPVVYGELRRLASAKMRHERSNHTLTSTALVHEAYLRLVDAKPGGENGHNRFRSAGASWVNRAHFFAAAAEAMRRILIENARRKQRVRHGGQMKRHNVDDVEPAVERSDELIALDDALEELIAQNELAGNLVKLRFFAGLTIPQTAWSLGISESHAKRLWAYSRAWLYRRIYAD